VMIRSETRSIRWANGTMKINPGPRASPVIFPSLNTTARSYCLMT